MHGSGNSGKEEVRDLVRASLLLSTLAGVPGAVLMMLIGHAVIWLGQDPDVVDAAKPILCTMAPGLIPCLWFQAIRQFTVGMRRPQAFLRITLASIAVNAGLNWALIHGTWIFPELGLPGIGLVYALSCLALYFSARRDARLAPVLSLSIWNTRPATVRRLTGLGTPIAATCGSEAGFFFVVALFAGSFGTAALAAPRRQPARLHRLPDSRRPLPRRVHRRQPGAGPAQPGRGPAPEDHSPGLRGSGDGRGRTGVRDRARPGARPHLRQR